MKKIIFLLSLISLWNCASQSNKITKDNNEIKNDTMEYFNIDKYKDWEVDTDHSLYENRKFLKKGNDRVEINFYKDGIVVQIISTINPYTVYKSYFRNNSLQTIGKEFYQRNIGKWIFYNENGKIVKEIDNDKPYPFSMEQLIEKIKKEYNVNLEQKTPGTWANRSIPEELKKPVYEVHLAYKDHELKRQYVLIDGTTGKTLFTNDYFMNDDQSTPSFFLYLWSLEKAEQEDNAYYKTYQGKDYTKKEWEIFEEEWHKNYKENKNKGFWDDIFPVRKKK